MIVARAGRVPGGCTAPVLSVAAVGLFVAFASRADVVNLTSPHSSGTINGAVFSTSIPHAAGTGLRQSLVRIRHNGIESGYNTSIPGHMFGRDEVGGEFTRDLALGEVGTIESGGAEYYQFFLDINEPTSASHRTLSVDDLRIYTSETAHTDYKLILGDLGTLRYGMDVGMDSRVELDGGLNPQLQGPGGGSGAGDMVMLVPVSMFAGATPDTFVYLYSRFGNTQEADGGFEEWWTRNPELTPLPAGLWLGAGGLGGVAGLSVLRRRRMRDAETGPACAC